MTKAVFGLGNPGRAYTYTRHNIGFEVIDQIRSMHRGGRRGRVQDSALVYCLDGWLLVKPLTFMNESGMAVRAVLQRHGVRPEDALMVYDDLDLPLGRIRLLADGGAGSHRGMQSILETMGTQAIPRLRIGIGEEGRTVSRRAYVLERFSREEWARIVPVVRRAAEAVDVFRTQGIDAAMTQFNRRE